MLDNSVTLYTLLLIKTLNEQCTTTIDRYGEAEQSTFIHRRMEDVSVTTSLQQLKMERSLSLNNTMNASNGTSPSFRRSQSTHRKSVFVIGVAGGTASGKTTVCDYIMQRLHGMCICVCLDGDVGFHPSMHVYAFADQCVVMLSQDSFYRGLTQEEKDNVSGAHHISIWVLYTC